MGEVWAARDLELDRSVALKLLGPEADPARFEREAHAAAALSHPNVTQLFDYGAWEGRPYMVLELLPGGTLEDRLRDGRPLPDAPPELARLADASLAKNPHARPPDGSALLAALGGVPPATEAATAVLARPAEATAVIRPRPPPRRPVRIRRSRLALLALGLLAAAGAGLAVALLGHGSSPGTTTVSTTHRRTTHSTSTRSTSTRTSTSTSSTTTTYSTTTRPTTTRPTTTRPTTTRPTTRPTSTTTTSEPTLPTTSTTATAGTTTVTIP